MDTGTNKKKLVQFHHFFVLPFCSSVLGAVAVCGGLGWWGLDDGSSPGGTTGGLLCGSWPPWIFSLARFLPPRWYYWWFIVWFPDPLLWHEVCYGRPSVPVGFCASQAKQYYCCSSHHCPLICCFRGWWRLGRGIGVGRSRCLRLHPRGRWWWLSWDRLVCSGGIKIKLLMCFILIVVSSIFLNTSLDLISMSNLSSYSHSCRLRHVFFFKSPFRSLAWL